MYRLVGFALIALASLPHHAFAQERVVRGAASVPTRSQAPAPSTATPKPAPTAVRPASTSNEGAAPSAPTDPGYIDPASGHDLSDVRGHDPAATGAGETERTISVVITEAKVSRILATPRMLRRMKADRTVAKLAEDFRACYMADPTQKTAPNAIIRVEVQSSGVIDRAMVESGASATPQVSACISSSAVEHTFAAPGGSGAAVLVQARTR